MTQNPRGQQGRFHLILGWQRAAGHRIRQERRRRDPQGFLAGPATGADGRLDRAGRLAKLQRLDQGPAARAFLTRLIKDQIHHWRPALGIHGLQRGGRHLDQVRAERPFLPAFKQRPDLRCRLPTGVAQQPVDFGDHLHVGIFDPVVHGLDEMPRPVRPQMIDARRALKLGRNRAEHGAQLGPAVIGTTHHHRRAMTRALFAARHAHADEMPPRTVKGGGAASGVVEIGVAAINDGVALIQQRHHRVDHRIHRSTRRDHEQDAAGLRDTVNKILKRRVPREVIRQRSGLLQKGRDPIGFAVADRHTEPLLGQIKRQRTAHRPQTINANICGL